MTGDIDLFLSTMILYSYLHSHTITHNQLLNNAESEQGCQIFLAYATYFLVKSNAIVYLE